MDAHAKLIKTLIKEQSSCQEINKRAIQASLLLFPLNKMHSVVLSSTWAVATHSESGSICLCRRCTGSKEPSCAEPFELPTMSHSNQNTQNENKSILKHCHYIAKPKCKSYGSEQRALAEVAAHHLKMLLWEHAEYSTKCCEFILLRHTITSE